MKLKEKIMPALVLMIICMVISGLVIVVYNLTYVDNTGVMTDELKKGCEEIFGKSGGKYEILLSENDGDKNVVNFGKEQIVAVIVDKENKNVAFEMSADGYKKGGLHLLVGVNFDGEVQGVSFIEITDTKGLGTKVDDDSFKGQFKGIQNVSEIENIDSITGATFSSKGVKSAVKTALEVYEKNKEGIFGE